MKRKFSLFVTIVVCLLLVVGILSACNEGEKKIASIDFADGEWQTNYYLGEVFEPCVATVTYEDGSTETVAVTPEMVKGFDTSKLGNYNIEITINGVTKVMTITVVEKGEEAHVHSMELTAAKEATCTEGGNNAYYHCSGCDKYFKDESGTQETTVEAETIAAKGHNWNNGEVTTAATCTEGGVMTYTCLDCAETKIETIPALGHGMTIIEAKDATCTEAGNNAYYYCSECNKYFKDEAGTQETTVEAEVISAKGHNWNNGEITTAATCTTDGVKTYTCLDCAETKIETIPALGHGMTIIEANAATCTEAGNNAYYHCSRCDKYFKDEAGTQETTVEAEVISATGHKWNNGEVTTAATCTEDGVMTYTCLNCSETKTETIAAAGHDYEETVISPTCTDEGYTLYECRNCDDSYTDNEVAALGHYMTSTEAKDATCTEAGNNAYYHCSRCDKYFKDIEGEEETTVEAETISAAGHKWDEGEITAAATCTEDGVMTYACLNCGETKTETIAATGHKWDEGEVTTAATCTEDGVMIFTCSNCNETKTETITAGHVIVDGVCTVCGELIYTEGLEYTLSSDKTYYIVTGIGTATGDIIIPDTFNGLPVRKIGEYAFYGCTDITSIALPANVTSIGDVAFYNCSNLNTLYYDGNIENWFNIEFDSNPLTYGADLYIDGELVTEVVIPESITTIGTQLSGCTSLTSITIHSGVTSIGGWAFYGCSSLTSIEIPSGVTSIGYNAFSGCSSLTSIEIPAGVTSIGSSAFYACSSLTSIEIPAGVTSIGSSAFRDCSSLESVTFAEGSQLTSIGDRAFEGCSSLTSIDIPAGVTSIGNAAFRGCSILTSIEVPAGLNSIGYYAFSGCSNLTGVSFAEGSRLTSIGGGVFEDCSSLTSIEIPAGVTSIGYDAFSGCSNLASVTFAEGSQLTSIGSDAFRNCSSLTSIEIPAGVTSIGGYAFSGCSNLNTVYYAGSIEDWFDIDFYGNSSNPLNNGAELYIDGALVTEVTVPESITTIGTQLIGYTSLTAITIHSGVTSIGSYAFNGCSSLASVTFAEGSQLTSIGDFAFWDCSSLTSIEIPAGVTSIGSSAFYVCSSLESVTFAEGSQLTSIGVRAFCHCSSLTSIEIPAGVTSIGNSAFSGCYLTIVYNYSDLEITAGSSDYGGVAYYAEVVLTENNLANVKDENGYVTYTDAEEVLLLGYLGSEKDIVIPEGVTRIAKYAFYRDDIVSVTLPESLTEIGDMAFNGCYNLKEVYNHSSLNITAGSYDYGYVAYYVVKVHNSSESESIFDDESGFAIVDGVLYGYKGSATDIIIPETVTSIAEYAFYGNTDIISVSIPSGVISIGESAFYECSNLESVTFADGSQLISIGVAAFYECSSLTSIEIPAGVSELPDGINGFGVFSGCSNLTGVSFAEGSQLTSIGDYAFYECSSLASIAIPAGVTSIGYGAFYGCSNLNTVYYAGSIEDWFDIEFKSSTSNPLYYGADLYIGGELVTAVVVPESITTIGNQLTGCTSLTSITLHSGVSSIGDHAFWNCSNLESVTFAEGSELTSIGSDAFSYCSSLTSIEIPAGVTSIGSDAFSGCSSLTSIEIPAGVTGIGDVAFEYCSSLTSIEIPAGVTSIGRYAFYGCSNLENVTFAEGSQLTSIGSDAFRNCSSLTSIDIPAGVTELPDGVFYSNGVFSGCSNLASVNFAEGSQLTSIGSSAFYGCSNLTSIEIPAGVTSIGGNAFEGCISLTSIEIPAGVTSIGYRAFFGCSSLTSIEIPAGVTSIGNESFYDTGAKNVYISDIEAWCNIEFVDNDSNPLYYGGVLWLNGEIVFELNIPGTVERIGNYAFYNAERVKNVVIEEGVTEIGDYAFYGMYRLESVTIPSTVTKIGSYAFAHSSSPDSKLKYIYYNGTEKDWLSVEKGANWDYGCGNYEVVFLGDAGAEA